MAAHPQIRSPLPVQWVQSPLTQKLESQGCSWVSIGMTPSLGCLSLPDIFTYDENTRLLMSKQDLCDSSGLWITTLTHYPSGNNSRVGGSKPVFMQSYLMGEMATWEPCYKINLESCTFTFGHINKCCPEGDSPGSGTSLGPAWCCHPQISLAVPWGLYWVLIQPRRSYLQTHQQSSDFLNDRHNSKNISGPHSKASPASSSLQAALWEEFGVGWGFVP